MINALCISANAEEKQYLDWFMIRTVTKLPGSFLSGFWTRLLLQASVMEPAVLHASLALSAVHKIANADLNPGDKPLIEQFALRHYNKAFNQLRTHFSKRDRESSQVILIACLVFISLECLRGHIGSAQAHIENGLRIIGEVNMVSSGQGNSVIPIRKATLVDEWIVEAVLRMDIQSRLLACESANLFCGKHERISIPRQFKSLTEAWKSLDHISRKVGYLSEIDRRNKEASVSPNSQSLFRERDSTIKALRRWLKTFVASEGCLVAGIPAIFGERALLLPKVHHTMITIMTEVCLSTGDEMAFDSQKDRFVELLSTIIYLSSLTPIEERPPPAEGIHGYSTRRGSIIDLGVISPLYYIATKCRLHKVRLRAIMSLERCSHQEGLWDPVITALVARKVVECEERGFYDFIETPDFVPAVGAQISEVLCEPWLPKSHRIGDVEMAFFGNPTQRISVYGKKYESKYLRSCVAEYDISSQAWLDDIHAT